MPETPAALVEQGQALEQSSESSRSLGIEELRYEQRSVKEREGSSFMQSCNSERFEIDLPAEGPPPTKQTIQNKRVIAHLAHINQNLQDRVEEKLQEFQKIIPKLPTARAPVESDESPGSPSSAEDKAIKQPRAEPGEEVERFSVLRYFTKYL